MKQLAGFSRQEAALVIVTMVWGGTFLAVQQALTVSGPLFFVGLKFAAAAAFVALASVRLLKKMTRRELLAGVIIGVSIFLGYVLQTYGLQTISSSKSAFITALYVPMVPLLQWGLLRKPPRLMSWAGIGLAFMGLVLLAGPDVGPIGLGRGEMLTVISAVAIAAEIILIGLFADDVDSRRVTVVQLAATAAISFSLMPVVREPVPAFSWLLVLIVGSLGLASAAIQLAMNWAQKSVSPTRATVIYASEPVWAGVVGYLAGERLPALALLGAALIVAGVIVSEWKLVPKNKVT
ncbi:DMT family transporter (plasmid) [Tundrisphaera sp. TA3]|uniref:DMT family transporter n=1 Tax=Tundrisphaera sp. TA3 TaxID=3435775 RepID=UPI003EBF16EB